MQNLTLRRLAVLALAIGTAFAWTPAAHAAGAININSCQTLSIPNTTYKLTADLTSCGDCLIAAADRITIDLQNHILTSTCGRVGDAITDQDIARELITVKNGTIDGYSVGLRLGTSTRSSVIGVKSNNNFFGITLGNNSLAKSCVARNNDVLGVDGRADRVQVQQCETSGNGQGILAGSNCLVTMNSANENTGSGGITTGNNCTVSYNTTTDNAGSGISVRSGSLVTQNTSMGSSSTFDFVVECPSDVTNNTSSGAPAGANYFFSGAPACRTVNNQ